MPLVPLFVIAYLAASVAIGLYAARRVRNQADYANAGRKLSLAMTVATVFATWFGAETVLGISATFLKDNLRGVVADPFGAALSLVVIGAVFAAPLYRLNLVSFGEYFRHRYNRTVEVTLSVWIIAGYVGWAAAQIAAMGLILSLLSHGALSMPQGMVIGAAIVLAYTLGGGMWAVALTDLFQATVIIAGMAYIGWVASGLAGGAGNVLRHAADSGKLAFWPTAGVRDVFDFIGAGAALALGSIPGQDTYQRAASARSARTAALGSIIGGVLYFLIALIPMYLAFAAVLIDPATVERLMAADSQLILPTLVLERTPAAAQVMFFGALLCAIMSSASAALLAPAVSFTENVLCPFVTGLSDRRRLAITRGAIACLTLIVLAFALGSGETIYQMVETSAEVTLVSAFVPLAAGLFWRSATTGGAACSIVCGVASWLAFTFAAPGGLVPPSLAGLAMSALGMCAGSLALPRRTAAN